MTLVRAMGMTLALSILAACSGGTGNLTPARTAASNAPVGATPAYTGSTGRVKATITLPRKKAATTTANKKRAYISPSTEGLIVEVDTVTTGNFPTPYSYTGYDLTNESAQSQCTNNNQTDAGETCTIYFNAPVTSSGSSDIFYIYAYDQPQTIGTIGSTYSPSGNLLSEDYDDTVPSANNTPNGPIVANGYNSLNFTLDAVVANPEVSYNTYEAAPLGNDNIVLSTSGDAATNGTNVASNTPTFSVDGYDEDDNEILSYESPNTNEPYENPILTESLVTTSSSEQPNPTFTVTSANKAVVVTSDRKRSPRTLTRKRADSGTLNQSTVGTSPQNDLAVVSYTPGSSDAPTTATSLVPSAVVNFQASFSGGFGDENSMDTTTYAEVTSSVTVAPLYSYVDPTTAAAVAGTTGTIYAIANKPATGANYTLTPASGYDCTGYSIGSPTIGDLPDDQQASWPITIGTDTNGGGNCVLSLSDGMSSDTITLPQPTATTTNVSIPNPLAIPVYQTSGYTPANTPYSFAAQNAGDTLLCIVSFEDVDTTIANLVTPSNQNDTIVDVESPNSYFSGGSGYFGEQAVAMDAQNAGDAISNIQASNEVAYWCAEYADTSAQSIANASSPNNEFAINMVENNGATPVTNTNTQGAILIQTASATQQNPIAFDSGFAQNASLSGPASLFVESSTGLEQGGSNQTWTPKVTGSSDPLTEGFIQIPISSSSTNSSNARSRHAHHKS